MTSIWSFGGNGIPMSAGEFPEEISGYAATADSPATGRLLLETGTKSGDPSKLPDALNWKYIISGGLPAAVILSACQITDG